MTDTTHRFTRRQTLAALGAVGLASAGAGMGTTAYFNDTESFEGNSMTAGELDLKVSWQQTYTGLNPTTGQIGTHYVNAFPDDNGDGVRSTRGVLYGVTWEEDLYVIDLQENEAVYIAGTVGQSPAPGSPNGIAYDPVNNRLYYSVDLDTGSELWFYDLTTDLQTRAGDLGDLAAGAGWYDGRYWYFHNRTDDLYAVSFDGAGMVTGETLMYGDLTGGSRVYRFGDVAVNADGMLYGSSLATQGSTAELFTVDLTDGTYTELYTDDPGAWSGDRGGDPTALQLAFDESETLFGQEAGSGTFFEIDPVGETVTELASVDDLRFTDLTQRRDLFLVCTRPDAETPEAFRTEGFDPEQEHLIQLTDVKPGDSGDLAFTLYLCDNPGYVWLTADGFAEDGGATTEPETEFGADLGELAEHVVVTLWYDADCDERLDGDEQLIFGPGIGGYTDLDGAKPATLAAAMEVFGRNGGRIPLDGQAPFMGFGAGDTDPARDCLPAETELCLGLSWELPASVGNVVQGDTLSLDLGFYTEQCRHNDGSGSAA